MANYKPVKEWTRRELECAVKDFGHLNHVLHENGHTNDSEVGEIVYQYYEP